MARSGVSLNWGGLDRALLNAARNLSERQTLLHGVGEMLRSSTVQRFEDGEDPEGTKWKPSKRAQAKGDKTLVDTARLRDSIDSIATSDAVMVGSKSGSNVEYARIHQMGGKAGRGRNVTIEPRPYLGVNAEDMSDIQEAVADFIADAFRGAK